ncbi:hypothetical protein AAT19DRAFT_16442 [Rhodotorula toruloides]|uniref:Uncharacterized protein n=1 Tax=Rhodotorula toruloides TaxID=5286 RepID=A0A2T0A3D0_RHOTO|nr:hypothetical protein AAT19DRAFT_16442 [Rhodotorula toruloides]
MARADWRSQGTPLTCCRLSFRNSLRLSPLLQASSRFSGLHRISAHRCILSEAPLTVLGGTELAGNPSGIQATPNSLCGCVTAGRAFHRRGEDDDSLSTQVLSRLSCVRGAVKELFPASSRYSSCSSTRDRAATCLEQFASLIIASTYYCPPNRLATPLGRSHPRVLLQAILQPAFPQPSQHLRPHHTALLPTEHDSKRRA